MHRRLYICTPLLNGNIFLNVENTLHRATGLGFLERWPKCVYFHSGPDPCGNHRKKGICGVPEDLSSVELKNGVNHQKRYFCLNVSN